jgi:hypothetical protein
MLLFLTNFLSILLAGGGTLALLGLSAASTKALHTNARRKAFIYITVGILLVAIPLAVTSYRVGEESIAEYQTRQLARIWLDQSTFDISRIEADGNQVELVISGSGDPPPLPDLGINVQSALDPEIKIRLKVVPSQILIYPEPASE